MNDNIQIGESGTPQQAPGNGQVDNCTAIVAQKAAQPGDHDSREEDAEGMILAAGTKDPTADPMRRCQYIAIEALVSGFTYEKVAEYARVDRKTLYRWMRNDKVFIAALSAARLRVTQNAENSLAAGAYKAAQVLSIAAERGSIQAATALLKLAGVGKGHGAGETEPPRRLTRSGKPRRLEMRLRELLLSLSEEQDEAEPAVDAKHQLARKT